MNCLAAISAALNLTGSLLLGLDLLLAPKALRRDAGLAKFQEHHKREFGDLRLLVLSGGAEVEPAQYSKVRAIAIRRRGRIGFALLILGFLLQLVDSLRPT